MDPLRTGVAQVDEDPVMQLLLSGEAGTLHEAEEKYLNASLPELLRLVAGALSDEALNDHPLMALLRAHGSRGWEDSVL